MNLPRLDELPANANREGVRQKIIEAMVGIDMDCDYDTMVEHYEHLLWDMYERMEDGDIQEIYDTCFRDHNEDEEV